MKLEEPNKYTKELLKENILEYKQWEKPRKVRSQDGTIRWEYVTITKLVDRRPYTKSFNERWLAFYRFFNKNPKAQMLFVIEHFISKNINKDHIKLTYKLYKELCEEFDLKPMTQPQFSNLCKEYEEANFLEKKSNGEYNFNTRYFYNGSLPKQLGMEEGEEHENL